MLHGGPVVKWIKRRWRHRDPLYWCEHCGIDMHQLAARHRETCPSVTGLYPADRDTAFCCWCGEDMDAYVYVTSPDDPEVTDCVCLGCGVLAHL